MQLSTPIFNPVERTATVYRFLMVALAALAIALAGQPTDPLLVPLGAAYVAATAALSLRGSHLARAWLVYPVTLVDIGIVTTVVSLPPATSLPLWALYLFPLASAAAAGQTPAAITAGLSVAGYYGATWLTTSMVPELAFWPVTVLAAATFLTATLSARWLVERQEKRAWQEIAAALRILGASGEVDEVATQVVERARRLVRAERVWLWWWDEAGHLRPGPRAGTASDHPVLPGALPAPLVRRLDRGPIPLADFGEPFAGLPGEVIPLRRGEARVALLAVSWNPSPPGQAARREQLRIFAPSAGDALAQAQARAALREELRRESLLRHAAMDLVATLDRQVAQEVVLGAARSGLRAAVSLVEPSSGRLLRGDAQVTEAPARLALDQESAGREVAVSPPARRSGPPLSALIEERLALMVWRAVPPLSESEAAWLDQLATLAQVSLERCAVYSQLRAEEQRLRASLDGMLAPFALWEAGGRLVYANAAYRALGDLGATPPTNLSSGEVHESEVVLDDPPRTFIAMTAPVAEGRYLVSIYREITRERQALRAKEELIAMVGHELRAPLTSIYGYSQMMARELGIVQRQVGQLNRLIGDLVDASQLEDGRLPMSREPIDLAEFARLAAERFRGAHQGRQLRLELPAVPPIEGDPVRLAQVLDNLLDNAAKYSPADQEIVLSIGVDKEEVILSVQDHGDGIEPEQLQRLFDRFYRVPGANTERVKGLGLGLSIVRDLVAAHGGRVWAESAGLGQGSTFRVSLPVAQTSRAVETAG